MIDETSTVTRRRVIASGVAGLAALSGCLEGPSGEFQLPVDGMEVVEVAYLLFNTGYSLDVRVTEPLQDQTDYLVAVSEGDQESFGRLGTGESIVEVPSVEDEDQLLAVSGGDVVDEKVVGGEVLVEATVEVSD